MRPYKNTQVTAIPPDGKGGDLGNGPTKVEAMLPVPVVVERKRQGREVSGSTFASAILS